MSKFNKLNKSSYGVQSFFSNKSQLEKLKKIKSGYFPKIVVATKQEVLWDKNTIKFVGTSRCNIVDGIVKMWIDLEKISNDAYKISGHTLHLGQFKSIVFNKRSNGKFYGSTPSQVMPNDHVLKIEFKKGLIRGRTTSVSNFAGIFLNAITLGAGICKFTLSREHK